MLSYVLRNDIYLKTFTGIVFAELSIKRCYKKMMQLRAKIQENYNFYCYHTGSLDHIINSLLNDHLPPLRRSSIYEYFISKSIMTEIITGQTSYHHKSVNRIRKESNELLIVFFFRLSPGFLSLPNKMLHVVGFELFPKQFRKKQS